MLFLLRAEAELVDVVDDLAEVVAAGDPVFDLAEDFADFVFDGVWAAGSLLEGVQVGEELASDEIDEVVAGLGFVVVEVAGFVFRSGPGFPAVLLFEDVSVAFTIEAASSERSCSRPSRYLRKRSQEVCSV